jgi:hypothetical protein
MMHPDPDDLGTDYDVSRVGDILTAMTDEDMRRDELPAGLWDRIATELPTADRPAVLHAAPDAERAPEESSVRGAPSGNVVDLDGRRRQRWLRVTAVAAAVVLAAGTVGVISSMNTGTGQELVASVDLAPLKDSGAGTAELISVDGVERIVITVEGLPDAPSGRHHEMWLIDTDVTEPRSLGELPAGVDRIEIPVPDGVDPDEFPIVDINLQVDGEAQHSGLDTSLLRGTLA